LHRHHALVPAGDDLPDADDELERLSAIARAVELLAVGERARVVHGHALALLRRGAVAHLLVDVLEPRWSRHRLVGHGRHSTTVWPRSAAPPRRRARCGAAPEGAAACPPATASACGARRRPTAPAARRARARCRRRARPPPPPGPTARRS